MFCKYCGAPIEGIGEVCQQCAEADSVDAPRSLDAQPSFSSAAELEPVSQNPAYGVNKKAESKKPLIIAVCVVLLCVLGVGVNQVITAATRCQVTDCNIEATCGKYCSEHVCSLYPSCDSRRASGSYYCSYHKGLLEKLYSKSNNITVSDVYLDRSSSYYKVTGKVTNNGSVTLDYVKVRAAFKNSSGSTIDTDWTYAVGSEGLKPGESTSFKMMVKKNSSIKTASVTVMDD